MKRNFWKIATASVGALALSFQTPAFAADDTTTISGTVSEITLVVLDNDVASFTKVGNTLTVTLAGALDYETNTTGKSIFFGYGGNNTLPSSTRTEAGVYDLTVSVSGGTGTAEPIDESKTWSSIEDGSSDSVAMAALSAGTDVHNADVTVTLQRHDGLLLLQSAAYSIPIIITVANG